MNELLVLASSTTNEEPTSPASTIVALGVPALVVSFGLIVIKKIQKMGEA